nr:unnamed protein product [Digitaria exilis]
MTIAGLKLELDELKTTATYVIDIVAPMLDRVDRPCAVPIHTQLKEVPGRVKALLKETAMVCTKHLLALLKSHYPQFAMERIGPVAKSVLSALIL